MSLQEVLDPNLSCQRLWQLFQGMNSSDVRVLLDNPNVCEVDEDGEISFTFLALVAKEFPTEVAQSAVFQLHALIHPAERVDEVVSEVIQRIEDVGLIDRLFSIHQSSIDVRSAAAENPKTPGKILRIIVAPDQRSYFSIRKAVALNPSTPDDVLQALMDESGSSVSK